jgi:hypothetical protein
MFIGGGGGSGPKRQKDGQPRNLNEYCAACRWDIFCCMPAAVDHHWKADGRGGVMLPSVVALGVKYVIESEFDDLDKPNWTSHGHCDRNC